MNSIKSEDYKLNDDFKIIKSNVPFLTTLIPTNDDCKNLRYF